MSRVSAGDPVPDFSLESDDGSRVGSSDLVGERTVIYFYPKDDTSGCTTEACDFRDLGPDFAKAATRVIGISPDSAESHLAFRAKHDLDFILLCDPDHVAAEAFGVWVTKKMYGREYMGVERSTFVIGPDGVIEQAFRKVRPKGHAAAVLDSLGA